MFRSGLMAVAMAAWASGAGATTPCPPGAHCPPLPPEFFMAMRAHISAVPLICAKHDPNNAARYAAAEQASIETLPQADREVLLTAAQNPGYPAVLEQTLEQFERDHPSDKLKRYCDAMLKAAPNPTPNPAPIDAASPTAH